jgi:hypothetical protein
MKGKRTLSLPSLDGRLASLLLPLSFVWMEEWSAAKMADWGMQRVG